MVQNLATELTRLLRKENNEILLIASALEIYISYTNITLYFFVDTNWPLHNECQFCHA